MVLDEGIVIREHRGAYEVETPRGEVLCALRSKLRKALIYPESENRRHTVETVNRIEAVAPVVVGDRVRIERFPDATGVIEEVFPRRSKLSRAAPGRRGVEQVIIANADQLVLVFAVRNPAPHLRLLDRLLIAAEAGGLTPLVCLNKMDLWTPDLPDIRSLYERIGYRVLPTSAYTGQGVEALGEVLKDRLSAIAGPSGAGKTSLLNALQPGLGLKVREISQATGKGRHTTTYLAAHKLDRGGMVIDTPGIREFSLWKLSPGELPDLFPEMRPYAKTCRFHNCTHMREPDCGIRQAVTEGVIAPERYDSFAILRKELEGSVAGRL
jgi:ribosome biogenesis GTPase